MWKMRYGKSSLRHVLLTCCLDGTARLWSEIDNGKARRAGKDNNDQKNMGCSYCVVAVIEINQSFNGTLGSDIFVTWGTEIEGIFRNDEKTKQVFPKVGLEHDVRNCDWLVGFGPGILTWAPSVLDDKLFFFMGHTRGIDCFIVNISRTEEENIECHYLCTIPFSGHGPYEDGPFDITFANKKYCITVNLCSCEYPSSNDLVTSFSVADPGTLSHRQQEFGFANDLCSSYPAYIMATGSSDGILKLWKSKPGNSLTQHLPWELVGSFVAHDGPIKGICFPDCGEKIATFCYESNSNAINTIHIWDAVPLISAGTFILEDKIKLESDVIALKWLTLGTGELLLGVCLQNELQVYAPKCHVGTTLSNSVNFPKLNIWIRIAYAFTSIPVYDFLWGPRASAVVIHGNYFSVFSHWLFHVDKKQRSNFHHYCDSEWSIKNILKDNNLSSSLFLAKEQLKSEFLTKVGLWSILEVAEIISGSLPTYHPDVLLTNISSGNWKRAFVALRHLVECLNSNYDPKKIHISKKIGLPNIALSYYLEGCISKGSQGKGFQWSGDATSMTSISQAQSSLFQFPYHSVSSPENGNISSTESELNGFIESLEKLPDLPLLIDTEKTQILAIIDLLSEVSGAHSSSAYQSLDEPGRRFWVGLRFQQLLFLRKFARAASYEELLVNSRLFVWAYHSDCLDNLFGSVIPNEPSWQEMRALGMGFWYANIPQLRARMEKLARAQYLKNKNPKDCALLYIALNRIQVLAGLFKISKDEKDKPLVGFLSRNFQDDKNKAAALKNAYVLLGKHQLELAIAFFLLGGDHSSAINICAKNLGDEQLALVLCRLVEGHGGPLEHHLITKNILPSAIEKGDYWLASLLEWEMGNYYESFYRMLEFSVNPVPWKSTVMSKYCPFLDPTIAFYCQMLATKHSMRNAVGEQNSAILLRWATLVAVTALKRCGNPVIIIRNVIFLLLCHHGALYIGYDMIDGCTQGELSQKKRNIFDDFNLYYSQIKPLFKTAEDVSFLYSRFFCACSMEYFQRSSSISFIEREPKFSDALQSRFEGVLISLSYLRAVFRIQLSSIGKDLVKTHLDILDFYEYYLHFSLAWLQRNAEALLYMVEPFLVPQSNGRNPYDIDMVNLMKLIPKIGKKYTYGESYLINMDSESISLQEKIRLVSFSLCDLLMTTVTHISSYHVKQHAEFLWQKVENDLNVITLEWLKQKSEFSQNQNLDILELGNRKDNYSVHQLLWDHCADPKLISDCFAQEKLNWPNDLDHMHTKGWNDLTRSSNHEVGTPVIGMSSGHASARSNQKDITQTNFAVFQSPREMYKRNGELLEALCMNSTDQREAAVASNRKGIMFFHLEDEVHFSGRSDDLLWAKADWPQNGWAGSESTPAPTCVSPGVGLGSKKGVHLGLGYAGIGASGLGWEIQQDFEYFVDSPATLENISTRALSSHPMRPFFLVGSSNTHIYLWEFNKNKATATYGVLPAANVPPPYALASISALQFDHFGHRFASAALDGTVCTWQLEVGGRSNVRPTESSLCFNGHASDVTYFSSSGSIIAVAGYSSSGVNVVIWDTLAPPTTSRASILCHEGGANTVSVFDNHVGSGSVSPLIVTGGKGGDVGLHDFRYIATGKAKRHRHADNIGQSSISSSPRGKDQNVDGMLWYIPKAHSGSVTKVVTIPNTSLFLTGSTDGDVKLWDAQSTKLVHHWSKIHEKHTFLQPNSRGFGGVVRAAVTDIQVFSHGFLTCGGDGTVKLIRLDNHLRGHGIEL
uniref:DmX-like protein 2 n=1 Tax=Cajanus cajan TaxID=3821 RepID=A0A151SIM7_CAJCA|nr:DmX-like protein 2 [Cajanus cajan]